MKTSPWPTLLTVLLASQLGGQSLLRCGTPEPTPAQLQASQVALNAFRQANDLSISRLSFDEVQVPVNFHIVMDNNGNGDVSNTEMTDQISVLNDSFQTQNVKFYLNAVTRTQNSAWASHEMDSPEETAMKNALAKHPERNLNFYICYDPQDSSGSTLLGYATFPDTMGGPVAADNDQGVVVLYSSLPGGTDAGPFEDGDTGTHEVGHYLGLWHVFQDGCTSTNDQCDDTPACEASYGTPPATTDTCPGLPGNDPVYNFMNYVDDVQMDHFTSDQRTRANDVTEMDRSDLHSDPYVWADAPWTGSGGLHTVTWMAVDVDSTHYPWTFHPQHGWMYCGNGSAADDLWLYTTDLGWLLTTDTTYPWIFRADTSDWLFYALGSDNPRWFFSSNQDQWFTVGTESQRTLP